MAGLLAAGPAQADRLSVGLGLSDGYGNFFSLGVNNGCRPCPGPVVVASTRVVYAQPAPVVYAQPAPVVYAQPAPVVYAQPAPVVYAQPAPVVYAQPAPVLVQPGGYWVEGVWFDFTDEWGHRCRRQGPGHWENHHSDGGRGGHGGYNGGGRGGFGGHR